MSNAYFAFRQFGVRQDRCGMKVSTDACIFGAWVPVPAASGARILDIGAGTGLLSLMLAQRAPAARVLALEIDAAAAQQAAENCADSLFADRILVSRADARTFTDATPFDLIVSNPPFFVNSLRSPDAARNAARHTDTLGAADIFGLASRLLAPEGFLALLLPVGPAFRPEAAAAAAGFYTHDSLEIAERPGAAVKRCCWLFSRRYADPVAAQLCVRDGSGYSAAFRYLLQSYYLAF